MSANLFSRCLPAMALSVAACAAPGACAADEGGQQSVPAVADYFRRAPIEIASFIPEYGRLDMVDYFTNGMQARTESALGPKVTIRSIDQEMLVYETDDSVTTAIALLPVSETDTVVMLIRTVPMPMRDSEISFYDKSWRPVGKSPLDEPGLDDWLIDDSRRRREEAGRELSFILGVATYDTASRRLTIENRTADFFVMSDAPAALGNLRDKLVYEWRGRRFVKLKDQR